MDSTAIMKETVKETDSGSPFVPPVHILGPLPRQLGSSSFGRTRLVIPPCYPLQMQIRPYSRAREVGPNSFIVYKVDLTGIEPVTS